MPTDDLYKCQVPDSRVSIKVPSRFALSLPMHGRKSVGASCTEDDIDRMSLLELRNMMCMERCRWNRYHLPYDKLTESGLTRALVLIREKAK